MGLEVLCHLLLVNNNKNKCKGKGAGGGGGVSGIHKMKFGAHKRCKSFNVKSRYSCASEVHGDLHPWLNNIYR